jgi:hypothetical protein
MIDRSLTRRDIQRIVACIDFVIEDVGTTGGHLPVPWPSGRDHIETRALENLRKIVKEGRT